MEMLCFGFLIGAVTAIIFVGIGIVFGRKDKDNGDDNASADNSGIDRNSEVLLHGRSDSVPDVHLRNRSRGGDERNNTPMEERAVIVLTNFRVGACRYETEVIDWLVDKLENATADNPYGFNPYQE